MILSSILIHLQIDVVSILSIQINDAEVMR
jgi:hypothetical protein